MAKLIEITGKAISGEWGIEDADGSGIPVLRTTNFTNEGIVNYENIVTRKISKKNIDKKYLIQGDIIIEKSGGSDKQPVGRVVFFEGLERKYLFNNFTGLLRIKDRDKHRVDLARLRNSSRSDDHLRDGLPHEPDGPVRPGGPEGDLRHRHSAGAQGFGQRRRVPLRIAQLDDRHHADLGYRFVHGVHKQTLLF